MKIKFYIKNEIAKKKNPKMKIKFYIKNEIEKKKKKKKNKKKD